ncbi:nitroreductase/quinone reductase family protein [Mycolicibacterium palauense]|uniref:nitroreductase/quinone reductase family protein n=1 Tax=Mycolicibacterium palauense TaxID=2034511 RepID=UPI000BFEF702|nr:nitroreductase/quinone reductase family protein [Mycolicibacterium palauense]
MPDPNTLKRDVVHAVQRYLINPVGRRLPTTMIETVGRTSKKPRRTNVGGTLDGDTFWIVAEHGEHADYVKNIKADPAVRLRLRGRWRTGTAHLLPDDDPMQRLRDQPTSNSAVVRALGTELLTVRVDLD